MSKSFNPFGWNRVPFPPYTGQWWAYTRHGTVEMVDVDLKKPKHLGKPEAVADTPEHGSFPLDPYVYQYSQGCTVNGEVLATRRWTHWRPVLPPVPPDDHPVAVGAMPPSPDLSNIVDAVGGVSVEHTLEQKAGLSGLYKEMSKLQCPFPSGCAEKQTSPPRHPDDPTLKTDPPTDYVRADKAHKAMRGPRRMRAGEVRAACADCPNCDCAKYARQFEAFLSQDAERKEQEAFQEMMDRSDASAYDPNKYAAEKATPLDLVEAAKTLAEQLLSLDSVRRESEYRRLKHMNPVMAALVKAAVEEYRRASGQWGKDAA